MPEQYSQQPGSMLDLRPTFFPLAFFLYFCKPYFSINGSPPSAGQWNHTPVPIPAGRYQVSIWVKYFISPQMGLSTIVVDVPPGAAAVITWRAPFTIWGAGPIAVAGVGPLAGATGGYGPQAQPGPPPAVASPGGWHPDPTRRHQLRYFDGSRWTDHVSDGNVQARDRIA